MSQNPHPARSPEFLSRLHDAELSPAERAHFESHRAHCAECRHAAAEFEAALSLYRSSRPAPAAPDLSARILRKLQSGRPRRSVFGPSFGIDLRWAGAFAAAVVAAIIGTSIVGKREAAERAVSSAAPIPVVVESRRGEPASPEPPQRDRQKAAASRSRSETTRLQDQAAGTGPSKPRSEGEIPLESQAAKTLPSGAPPEEKHKLEAARERDAREASDRLDAARRTMAKYAEAPAPPSGAPAPERSVARQAPAAAAAAPAPRTSERAGGEGANSVAADAAVSPLRIRLEALDGISGVPGVLGAEAADLPAHLRGSRWVLMIDGAGRVRQARRESSTASRKDGAAELRDETPDPILALRFVPGDRPRRVLLRLE